MRKTFFLWVVLIVVWSGSAPAQIAPTTGQQRYAVTLLSSFEPIPAALLPTDLKAYRVYRTQSDIFGKNIYFVRLGFFTTAAEATAMRDKLATRYPGAFMTEVTAEEFNSASPRAARAKTPEVLEPAQPQATREDLYIITLMTSRTSAPTPTTAMPAALKGKRIYLRDSVQNGGIVHKLQLGFFFTAAEAEAAVQLLVSDYPEAKVHPASTQEQKESSRTMVAVPGEIIAKTPEPSIKAPVPAPELGREGTRPRGTPPIPPRLGSSALRTSPPRS